VEVTRVVEPLAAQIVHLVLVRMLLVQEFRHVLYVKKDVSPKSRKFSSKNILKI
jgi:hypothetical protein